jgi:hypothetical protein
VHHRKPTDGRGEDFRKFLEPVFEPLLRLWSPSPSKNALRTLRDTQWHHRVTVRSTNFARAIAMGNLLWGYRVVLYAMPEDASRSVELLVFKNQHRDGLSLTQHGREAMQCVSFPLEDYRGLPCMPVLAFKRRGLACACSIP